MLETLIGDIESSILSRLQSNGLQATSFQICDADNIENIICPAINCAFWNGSFKNANLSGSRLNMTAQFYLTIIVQNAMNEEARRHAVYPMVMSSLNLLTSWRPVDQGGEIIEGAGYLAPSKLRKTYESKTRIAFTLELAIPLTIQLSTPDEAAEVLTIAVQYMIKAGDDTADAEDVVQSS